MGTGVGLGLGFREAWVGVGAGGNGATCCTGLSGSKAGLATSLSDAPGRGVEGVEVTVHLVPEPVRRKLGGAVTGVCGGGIGVFATRCAGGAAAAATCETR